jgi:hypothetical protein
MDLKPGELAPNYGRILERCEPFLITYPANLPALDLAPFGHAIAKHHQYTATSLKSRDVVDGLHRLDAVTFGDQDMLMPRWVMFDCGEFPGVVFGFGMRAKDLPDYARKAYEVLDRDDAFVPLSMWVAIRCAEEGAWFGHNLSSGNLILKGDHALAGLAVITKIFGVRVAKAKRQYGATQWQSKSIGLHARLGEMQILSAYTPAHTHDETFAYLIEVDDDTLVSSLRPGWKATEANGELQFDADDSPAIRKLHDEIEAGKRFALVRSERREGAEARIHLRRCD